MKLIKNIFKSRSKKDEIFCSKLKKIIGFYPKNTLPYKIAFTHPSLQEKDKKGNPLNFERLEYLGDSILGAIISSYLYTTIPDGNEGQLTQLRSKIVNREHLNELGVYFNLVSLLNSKSSKSKIGNHIHGNLFESLVGAIYMDKGYDVCSIFIHNLLKNHIDIQRLDNKISSYKGVIIEWSQKKKVKLKFESYEDSGNQKTKHFSVKLLVNGKVVAKGRATSKKKAEEVAAKRAYFQYKNEINKTL